MKPHLFCPCLLLAWSSLLPAVPLVETRLEPFAPVPPRVEGPIEPAKPMEKSPPELADAANLDRLLKDTLGVRLPDEARKFLAKNHFVLLDLKPTRLGSGGSADEMLTAFDDLSGDGPNGNPRLVTPDLFLHAFHRFFSHSLEWIEQGELRPRLELMLQTAMTNAAALRQEADALTATRLTWIEAQLATAWIVLGTDDAVPAAGHDPKEDPEDPYYSRKPVPNKAGSAGQVAPPPKTIAGRAFAQGNLQERLAQAKEWFTQPASAAIEQ